MKPNRQEKYDVLQDVARQLEHNITPFHTTKERAQIERKIEVLLEIAKDLKPNQLSKQAFFNHSRKTKIHVKSLINWTRREKS